MHCIYRFWSTKCSDKTPLNLSDSWDQLGLNLDFQCPELGHLSPLGPNKGPFSKKWVLLFCVFSRYLCNGKSSVDPTLILQCRAPGLFIAKMIFLEMFSALRKSGLLRHVTSRHVTSRHVTSRFVTVNLFSNKRTPNGYYVPPWVNIFIYSNFSSTFSTIERCSERLASELVHG